MIRKLPEAEPRVESGPIQFGDDWPGMFIRGDDCAFFALHLETAYADIKDPIAQAVVMALVTDLKNTRV